MNSTNTILDNIVASKRQRLIEAKERRSEAYLERELAKLPVSDVPGFYDSLKAGQPHLKIIAEIKKNSPSSRTLSKGFSVRKINDSYQAARHVIAISVITEVDHFQGSDSSLNYVATHNTGSKPLLRKDFIFDTYQILEAKLLGAQAFLLIASLFSFSELQLLVAYGQSLGIEPLVEVHTRQELQRARRASARCIGVNSRNLHTFGIDITTHELLRDLDDSYVRIAESGIDSSEYLRYLSKFTDAALIGSYFMQAKNITVAINNLTTPAHAKGVAL